jgi:predicted nucleic acid-binding protein
VRYWDASALLPLVVKEESSARIRARLDEDPLIVTWAWTRVELASAVERRVRDGSVARAQRRVVIGHLEELASAWDEVVDVLAVRARALSLLARHPLRAADAAQLGAALLAAENEPGSLDFVCLDERLNLAAEKEGLRVVT